MDEDWTCTTALSWVWERHGDKLFYFRVRVMGGEICPILAHFHFLLKTSNILRYPSQFWYCSIFLEDCITLYVEKINKFFEILLIHETRTIGPDPVGSFNAILDLLIGVLCVLGFALHYGPTCGFIFRTCRRWMASLFIVYYAFDYHHLT